VKFDGVQVNVPHVFSNISSNASVAIDPSIEYGVWYSHVCVSESFIDVHPANIAS
jgi:hypothetical protein